MCPERHRRALLAGNGLDKGADADEHYPNFHLEVFSGFKLGLSESGLPSVWELPWVPSASLRLSLPHIVRSW
jgi:hypothetical protein